jgi:hypothetical protein
MLCNLTRIGVIAPSNLHYQVYQVLNLVLLRLLPRVRRKSCISGIKFSSRRYMSQTQASEHLSGRGVGCSPAH